MVQLKQITRNATFAWSPAQGKPLLASGTIAGAVDANFSQDSELEIWDLDLDNADPQAFELAPTAKISTERKFYSLAWGHVTTDKPSGVIAGAMDDGHLNIWDVNAILANTPQNALVTSNQTHRGAIRVVEFNPVTTKLLMSAGQGGEFNIWDLENPTVPFPAPNRASRVEDIEAASWNRKVANILATGSGNGFTSIWDLKQSREILHLRNPNRERVSSLAWDPDNPTRIITGCDDTTSSVLYVWDLRNSHAPAQVLEGHAGGVLSVAWCDRDHDLLLSCGKDNRTLLWNPQVPKLLGEFPIASTWAFEAQWCPQNPNILANATFEGKITVHRLQSSVPKQEVNGAQAGAGEDFFSQRQYVSEGGFELKQPPKWFQVPCSSSFGFGGSLITVKNEKGKGAVKIRKFISEPKISENATEFEEAIQSADWTGFCDKQIEKASTDAEKGNWKLLKILFDAEPKKSLIEYLGVKEPDVAELTDKVEGLKLEKTDSEATVADSLAAEKATDTTTKNSRLSGIFGGESDFLSQLSSSTDPRTLNTPFSILSTHDSTSDKSITQAILFGHFEKAVDLCLKEDRLSDAFVLATLGDKVLQKKVQDAYFARKDHRASYLRVLQSVIDSNLWDVAEYADLAGWKETLVFFCTYAKTDEDFSGLCDSLGKRLEGEKRVEDAKVCYLAGKKLDQVVNIWIAEADAQEKAELKSAEKDSAFSIHARALQGFVEKVTVFKQTKGTGATVESKALYDKYTEFVEIVASQGNLSVAEKYIDLLPADNETVKSVKTRLAKAMSKPVVPAAPAVKTPGRAQPAGRLGQPPIPTGPTPYSPSGHSFQPSPYTPAFPPPSAQAPPAPMTGPPISGLPKAAPYAPPTATTGPYAPPAATGPYAPPPPPASITSTTYTPPIIGTTTPSQQPSTYRSPYTPAGAINQYTPGFPPTNAAFSRIADLPPPPKKTGANWNDPPMLTNPLRTRTPVAGIIQSPSPFTGASGSTSPNLAKAPPAPPPTSAKPPQRVKSPAISSPPMGGGAFPASAPPRAGSAQPLGLPPQGQQRPAPTSFTPPPQRSSQAPPPPPPMGQGLRAASGRPQYAAIPGMQSQQQNNVPTPPPPSQGPSQYAPVNPPSLVGPRNPYAPAATIFPPETPAAPPSAPAKQVPPQPKYPPGDRSHIPASSKPIYDIFSGEIGHIKTIAQAPQQKRIVADVDKRLNILFDLLNNDENIPGDVTSKLVKLAEALSRRQYDMASQIQLDLHTEYEQYSAWMIGIKRLIDMSRAFATQ